MVAIVKIIFLMKASPVNNISYVAFWLELGEVCYEMILMINT